MSFLQPTYLWGLLSLLVPLVIHLLNKGDVQTIKVGSVRYLTEQETKQTRQIKLNELLLLFLRMFLLALLVFAMAEPVLQSKKKMVPLTYLMEPSLVKEGRMDALLTEVEDVSLRYFCTNFPSVDMDKVPEDQPQYWQLAQDLQRLDSDSIIVFTKSSLAGIQGVRPAIPSHVSWIVMDELALMDSLVSATAVKDGAFLHTVKGNESYTDIEKEFITKDNINYTAKDSIAITQNGITKHVPIASQDTLRIGMCYDVEFLRDKELLSAAFSAVANYTRKEVFLETVGDSATVNYEDYDLLVWLKKSVPQKIPGKLLRYKQDSLAVHIIEKTAQKNIYHLTDRLTIEKMLNEGVTETLVGLLAPDPQLEKSVVALDKRTMAAVAFLPKTKLTADVKKGKQQRNTGRWFWMAALCILLLERLMAKFRKQ